MRLWRTHALLPVVMTRGEGCTLIDASGKSYLDLLSGTWCNILGYGHPRWVEAVRDQADKLAHVGSPFATAEIEDALAKLAEVLPSRLQRTVFLSSGSEAVEFALKVARAATGADAVAVFERGYYGATTYALALSEAGRTARYLPVLGSVHRLPAPDCRHCPIERSGACDGRFPCLDSLERLAEDPGKRLAAVLYEPVMGGGILVPPIGYGARLRDLASRCNALLVAEEVTTGMGRTGRWFGFEHDGIVPDILVIGKAIGAGLPVSAVVTTSEVEARSLAALGRHVQSHQNDPFAGRIASTVIAILQAERLVERAAERGGDLRAGLEELAQSGRWFEDVRGRGAMVGAQLHADVSQRGAQIAQRLLEEGFVVDYHVPSATFRFFPPFVISREEIDDFLRAFRRVLSESEGG